MLRRLLPRLLWIGFVVAGAAPPAGAHDPFEITAMARLRAGVMEVDVTMARSTALAIAWGVPEAPTFAPADFSRHQAGLVAAAPGLFRITAGGRPLVARTAEVSLGRENDVDFHLVYAAPGAGPLRFEAVHIARLPLGHGNALVVRDDSGVLGNALLRDAEVTLEVMVPPVAGPVAPPSRPAFVRPGLIALTGIVLFAGAWWWRQRHHPDRPAA